MINLAVSIRISILLFSSVSLLVLTSVLTFTLAIEFKIRFYSSEVFSCETNESFEEGYFFTSNS
ncbi:hypothetical protein SAMN05444411_106205 [Lutibacter oricola]|uniref:Uncharacterized protein n=1 Tax=Lutibacter oricola TaxID=762486 RepID=A0A1H3CMG4_9FLAO|nr:hypothetical protein SAMN05444411_106205 [Lutibacter oricola]